ncbi:MAG TPA: hypothetical protein VL945_01630 [Candidatus Saccharimonadales bacterium]|nr:hypothetical protein [Candidatus Saccharimonadales bacterium]
MDTIVLTCMDPRLNEYLDKKYLSEDGKKTYGKVEIWRNASGRLPPIEEITNSGAREIILAPHTDCAAKRHMYEMLKQDVARDEEDKIVEQVEGLIEGQSFATREEFDALVNKEEETFLKEKLSKTAIKVKMDVVDLSKLKLHQHTQEKMLVISNETDTMSEKIAIQAGIEMASCYIIQGPYLKDMNPDINLALSLGIKRVNILTEDGTTFK